MRLPIFWPFPVRIIKDMWSTMAYGRSFLGCTVGWQRLSDGTSTWACLWVAPHGRDDVDEFELQDKMILTLNRVAKWRTIFAGWQLGSRSDQDGECLAVRDHRDATTMLRIEVNALTRLMLEKGIFTTPELQATLIEEAEALDKMYEQRFPGAKATESGMSIDVKEFLSTTKRLHFPE